MKHCTMLGKTCVNIMITVCVTDASKAGGGSSSSSSRRRRRRRRLPPLGAGLPLVSVFVMFPLRWRILYDSYCGH